MNYQKIRPQIRSGDLLFWENRSIWSYLVSFVTRSPFTHVGVAWVVADRVFILESTGRNGVAMQPLSLNLPCDIVHMGLMWNFTAEKFALAQLKKRYGWFDALRAGFGIRLRADNRWICSEYCIKVLSLSGYTFAEKVSTPGDMYMEISREGFERRYINSAPTD